MGFPNVYAIQNGVGEWTAEGGALEEGMPAAAPFGLEDARSKVAVVTVDDAETMDATVIFVGTSPEFAVGHVTGARWTPRGWLELVIGEVAVDKVAQILVTCVDGVESMLAGATLVGMGYANVVALDGGMKAWRARGLGVELGLSGVMTPPADVVVMGPHRSYADTIHYLRWETDLGHKYAPTH